jgi:D-alanyl-D-alanine dipeptidase
MKRQLWAGIYFFLVFTVWVHAEEKPDDLVEITNAVPAIRLDIRYATTNNFTHQVLYKSARAFARRATVKKLAAVQKELEAKGLGLKIYDGYRPFAVTKTMWDLIHDDRFVADPAKGSKHNRGAALDLTLVDKAGKEISMPTGYDNFTEKASRDCKDLPKELIKHRDLLRQLMEKNGFESVSTEWWHFNDVEWEKYPIMDVPFEKLK